MQPLATTSDSLLPGNPARALAASPALRVLLFLTLHIPLAPALGLSGWVGTAHGALVLLVGLHAALRQNTERMLATLGYIAGAEILWRMTGANLFWEFGKYASVAIILAALLVEFRSPSSRREVSPWPVIFFVLLLPATIPTIATFGLAGARDAISFNLSGPLLLALTAFWLWKRPLGRETAVTLFTAITAPVLSIAFLTGTATFTQDVTFTLDSNFATSGGFGPNQVSNVLGFGALAAILLFILAPRSRLLTVLALALAAVFTMQALLTFSRGGVFSFLLAGGVAGLHLLAQPRVRRRFMMLLLIAYTAFSIVVLPRLDTYTDGLLLQRFTDLQGTGREEAIEADLLAFRQHPITGVGVGLGTSYRGALLGTNVAAHTEYTRLLGEHGLPGLASLLLLLVLLGRHYMQTGSGLDRALTAALAIWGFSVMTQSAMRFAAISLAIGLAFASWQLVQKSEEHE